MVLLGPDPQAAPRGEIRQPDRAIIATCRQAPAIGMHGQRANPPGVTLQGAQTLPAADLPDLHQPIVAPADQPRPLRIEGQRPDMHGMTYDRQQWLAVHDMPEMDLPTIATGSDILPVSAERYCEDDADGLHKDGTGQVAASELGPLGIGRL